MHNEDLSKLRGLDALESVSIVNSYGDWFYNELIKQWNKLKPRNCDALKQIGIANGARFVPLFL